MQVSLALPGSQLVGRYPLFSALFAFYSSYRADPAAGKPCEPAHEPGLMADLALTENIIDSIFRNHKSDLMIK